MLNFFVIKKETTNIFNLTLTGPSTALNNSDIEFIDFLQNSLNFGNNTLINFEEIIQSIELINGQHKVLNVDRFGQLNSFNVEAVVLVQVRKFFRHKIIKKEFN